MVKRSSSHWLGDPSVMPQELITLVDIVNVASTTSPTSEGGSVTFTLGSSTSGETYTTDAMLFNPPGLMSLPVPTGSYDSNGNFTPSQTAVTGSQALCYIRDDQYAVFSTRDVRAQSNPGNIQMGETCLYGLLGQGRVICKLDGSVTLITTTTNDAMGANVQLSVTPTGLYFNAPWGKIAFDAAGFRISTASGGSFSLIGTSNPISGTAFIVNAGSVAINSSLITLGNTANIAPFPVVYGIIPAAVPGIPILGAGVGVVTVAASASTGVFVGA